MKNLLLLTFLLLAGLTGQAQQTGLAALLRRENVPGIQLIHTKSGKSTVYNLGLRKAGSTAAVDARTVFQAA
ncbi:hypothetical protein [Hymenobacter fastidiosus]|uniref:hypothetical protein n=1 Tax=Hymenobacter fastidiosus TaxID=486264 RepID=UPI0031E56E29